MNIGLSTRPTVAITGAAGNLGSLLAYHLLDKNININLLIHKKLPDQIFYTKENCKVFKINLRNKETISHSLENVDTIVHFAGVLFKANPEKFLPTTNVQYFNNLLETAVEKQVKRIILISFPHVEGESTPDKPATGHLNGKPDSVHAKTRLMEEIALFNISKKTGIEAISLRVGMVYGKGILMIDAAQWLAKHYLLGIWKKDTYIHLISKIDFLNATEAAIILPEAKGIYHLGDDGIQTLQEFLDTITSYKKYKKPWKMPMWMINTAAFLCEIYSFIFNTASPLTRDFIKIGKVSYYGDTARMRKELLPELKYKNYKEGIHTF